MSVGTLSSESNILNLCKDLRFKSSKFPHYHRPAQILTVIAIVLPLTILALTSPEDENGESDWLESPYAIHSGIIFLGLIISAYFFSNLAKPHKIKTNQIWAIKTYDIYENLIEFKRKDSLEDYKIKAKDRLDDLVSDISSKINDVDDKIKWIIPFANPIEEIKNTLDDKIFPLIESGDKDKIEKSSSFLITLMEYFLNPTEEKYKQLESYDIPKTISVGETIDKKSFQISLPLKQIGMFGIFAVVGLGLYFAALEIDIDKNSAFMTAGIISATLSGGYFAYLKR